MMSRHALLLVGTFITAYAARLNEAGDGDRNEHRTHSEVNDDNDAHEAGILSDIKHIGDPCMTDSDCGSLTTGLECYMPDGGKCKKTGGIDQRKKRGCTCRQTPGRHCLEASDCGLSATCTDCTCVIGKSNSVGKCQVCDLPAPAKWACKYNAAKNWNTVWQHESLYNLIKTTDLDGTTDRKVLEKFIPNGRFYGGKLTRGQVVDLMTKGANFFFDNMEVVKKVLGVCSLPTSYKLIQVARVLWATGELGANSVKHRVGNTGKWIYDIMEQAGRDPNEGHAFSKAFSLGNIHARKDARALAGKRPFTSDWQETPFPSINMEMMLWVELCFSVVTLDGMERVMHMDLTEDEKDTWVVIWSLLGNALGVRHEFYSYAAAKQVFESLRKGPDFYKALRPDHVERQAVRNLVQALLSHTGLPQDMETACLG